MRLEFETTTLTPLVAPATFEEFAPSDFATVLRKGITAAKDGERETARELLMQATELEPLSDDAWMWLASISDYPEELVAFLNNALTANPSNVRAKKWLAETEKLLVKKVSLASAAAAYEIEDLGSVDTVESGEIEKPNVEMSQCPFCYAENEARAFVCQSCKASLSLSDIEALLSNPAADRERIYEAVTNMDAEWNLRELEEKELITFAIGHINLRNYDEGVKYLHEALGRNPNNVILAGQINAIAIRLDEIRRQKEIHNSKPKGKTILVVDDSATVRKLISSKLEKSGHNVVCAVDGVDGLEKIAECQPDLVFLDITMPRKDGYVVCKEIRSNPAGKDLPVVMISGKDGFFDKVRGKMAGASGYVTKPFGPETLMKALENHLASEESLQQ